MSRHLSTQVVRPFAAAAAILALAGCSGKPGPSAATATPLPPVASAQQALAEGKVVPARHAALAFQVPGTVAKVLVKEGDAVKAGQALVRLDSSEQATALLQARANLRVAQADLDRLRAGAPAADVAGAQAAVDRARAGEQAAAGQVAQARAGLQKVEAGATAEEIAIAQRQVEEAKNTLWGFQGQRDAVCGRAKADCNDEETAAKEACKAAREDSKPGCDQAQANVQAAEERVHIAELQLAQVRAGPRTEDRHAAQGTLAQTQGLYKTASAGVREAEAALAGVQSGASTQEIAAASARVDLALAALQQAAVRMSQTELRAPFAGTVAALDTRVGEPAQLGSPVVQLADLDHLQVRTEDLTEINVIGLQPGASAAVTFDAIPGLTLPGKVASIRPYGDSRQGDIVYTVLIDPEHQDPRLRWNMTASVAIDRP
jgi:HlyD family secretion protein